MTKKQTQNEEEGAHFKEAQVYTHGNWTASVSSNLKVPSLSLFPNVAFLYIPPKKRERLRGLKYIIIALNIMLNIY